MIAVSLIFDQVDNKDMKEGTIKIVRVNFATLNMMLDSLPYSQARVNMVGSETTHVTVEKRLEFILLHLSWK